MNLTWVDWAIVAAAVVGLRFVSLSTRSHCKGVADFLSANRTAGRYLLAIASQMGGMGVISFVAGFEMYYKAGLPAVWWSFMSIPVLPIILLTGFVYWRFRETRALTMAQFFEMRYSRRFRVFAGIVIWACGILNFGIFPAVAARFLIYFCGLPNAFHIVGLPFNIPTFPAVMALDLGVALVFVNMGGQISVMVTECAQGIFSRIAFLVIVGCIFVMVPWSHLVTALNTAPVDASLLHPYHTGDIKDFDIWFFLIGVFGNFYWYMSWMGGQGFFGSARTPHEQQMGGLISVLRSIPVALVTVLMALAALAVVHLPQFSAQAAAADSALKAIPSDYIRSQMIVPVIMGKLLPIGIKGLLATTMLFFSFTCHDTYMHSWGSTFIQDVVMPFRKKPLNPAQHIRLLRWSIAFVALFGFLFSLLYPQNQPILMFFAITGTIWCGGSGAVIIGGMYWKRATTEAAYATVVVGAVLGVAGLFADQIWQYFFCRDFPVNGRWLSFIAVVIAIAVYVLVSFITGRKHRDANLEKILRRGRYALATNEPAAKRHSNAWLRLVGITEHFSFTDKCLAIGLIMWNFGWLGAFLVITGIHFAFGTSTEWWTKFWHFYIILQFVVAIPATIWFTVGGIIDIKALFRRLEEVVRDPSDDGSVHHDLEEKTPGLAPDVAGSGRVVLKLALGEEGGKQEQ